jgi:DNA-binding LacI/PurR family transcriptional regulator
MFRRPVRQAPLASPDMSDDPADRVRIAAMRESGRARLVDVARLAGVGKTTASDALTGTGRVSEGTRRAVLAAADQLGYRPNAAARHLRQSSTGALAIVLPEVSARSAYYMAFAFGVIGHASRADYDVTVVTRPQGQQRPRDIRADGVIIADPRRDDPAVDSLLAAPVPVVTGEHVLGGAQPDGVVYSDHEAGMSRLMDHLDGTGFRRPALIVAADDTDWSASLSRGFASGCAERDLEPVIRRTAFEAPSHQVRAATQRILVDHPDVDAIIVGPDGGAVEVLSVLHELGRDGGADIAVASCVDYTALQFLDPPVTALDLRPYDAGVAAAELLIGLLNGTAPAGTEREHDIVVVPRASTAHELHVHGD